MMNTQPQEPIPVVSKDAMAAIYEMVCTRAIQNLQTHGHVEPTVLAMHVAQGETRPASLMFVDPQGVLELSSSKESRVVLGQMMHALIDASTPMHTEASKALGKPINLVIHISEAWALMGERAMQAYANGQSPSESDDRSEIISLLMYSSEGIYSGITLIERDVDGKPSATFDPGTFGMNKAFGGNLAPAGANQEIREDDGVVRARKGPSLH